MIRDGLSSRISKEPDLEVCGEAEDVDEALRLVSHLSPDLVVIDISLKTGHGIDLMKQIRKRYPGTKMLVSSMYDEAIYAERSLNAGASGYINKQVAGEIAIDAIRAVLAGNIYLSPEMTNRIMRPRLGKPLDINKSPIDNLSDRELEVLTLIGNGQTSRIIAKRLHLSVHTIDTHREKLKMKLNLDSGAELNRYAVQWVLENG